MKHISVKIPTKMYQDIESLACAHELKISDIMRKCLRTGLQDLTKKTCANTQLQQDAFLYKSVLPYSVGTYCLIEAHIQSMGVEIVNIQCRADTEMKKIISETYQGIKMNVNNDKSPS